LANSKIKRILVVLDGSKGSSKALDEQFILQGNVKRHFLDSTWFCYFQLITKNIRHILQKYFWKMERKRLKMQREKRSKWGIVLW